MILLKNPLSRTKSQKNGGELGIRTLGTPFEVHEISSFALSTTQTTLRADIIILHNRKYLK